jgi:hypothetical protein
MGIHIIISLGILLFIIFLQSKFYFEVKKLIVHLKVVIDSEKVNINNNIKEKVEGNEEVPDYVNVLATINYSGQNKNMIELIDTLNEYLERNKGAVSDFNLIRDIVERKIELIDSQIQSRISVPLFIGLIGTMLGIIVGVGFFLMESDTEQQIFNLLMGVCVAMIGSVAGLSMTLYNTNVNYKNAKEELDFHKNAFFSFIQTRLMPVISQNPSTSIYSLQANLLNFNETFAKNLRSFDRTMKTIKSTFDSQVTLVEKLDEMDIQQVANANITILNEFTKAISKTQDFGSYINQLVHFIDSNRNLEKEINQQIEMVGNINSVISRFENHVDGVNKVGMYLADQFSNSERREQIINNKVADFDVTVGKMIDNLQINFNQRLQAFNNIDATISDDFKNMFSDVRKDIQRFFDDEKGSISHIKSEQSKLMNLPTKVDSINSKVEKLDTRSIFEEIKEKPILFNLTKRDKILAYIFVISGIITFIIILIFIVLIIYKLFNE